MMDRIAVVPGSFDPITLGHIDLIARAASMFDTVHAVAMINSEKKYLFSMEQRFQMMKDALREYKNVHVAFSDGMLWQYAKNVGACAIVKGVRNWKDFEYEMQMQQYNIRMYPLAETVFIPAKENMSEVSSSAVRELCRAGEDISHLVPPNVEQCIRQKINK